MRAPAVIRTATSRYRNRANRPGPTSRRRAIGPFTIGFGNRNTKRTVLALALLAGSLTFLGPELSSAAGETLTVVVAQVDGTPAWSADDAAGHDSGPSNGIVRTNDTLTYNVELKVADAPSTGTTLVVTLPKGTEMTTVPAFCTGAGSALNPTTLGDPVIPVTATTWTALPVQTLTCNVGSRTANSTFTYPIIAKVRPEVPNGTALDLPPVTATTTDVTTPVQSNTLTATVSARAQFDISKNSIALQENTGYFYGPGGTTLCNDGTGRQCFFYAFPVLVSVPAGGKGSTPMASDLTFTDNVAPEALYGPAVTSDPEWLAAGGGALGKYGAIYTGCGGTIYLSPGDRIDGAYTAVNSVRDSGTVQCAQPGGPGTPIQVTATNVDTTAYTYPTESPNPAGAPLPASAAYVFSMQIVIQIPVDAATDLGVQPDPNSSTSTLAWDNKLEDFAPTGLDGTPNDPDADPAWNDHRASAATVQDGAGIDKWFAGLPNAPGNTDSATFKPGFAIWEGPAGSTGINQGEGQIYAGQTTISTLNPINTSTSGNTISFLACDSWDPTKLQLTNRTNPGGPLIPGSSVGGPNPAYAQAVGTTGPPVWISGGDLTGTGQGYFSSGSVPDLGLVVEYGTGDGGSGAASACGDADSPTGWTTDPEAVPGNDPSLEAQGVYSAVARVRVRLLLPPGQSGVSFATVSIGLHSVPGAPAGTVLPNWASFNTMVGDQTMAALLPGARLSTYDPTNNTGDGGDRLRTTPAIARLRKEVKDPGNGQFGTTVPGFTGGQIADFKLKPTLTVSVQTDATTNVSVEDCIPVGTIFLPATASISPTTVSPTTPGGAGITCGTGETYVKWDLGQRNVSTQLPEITYSARVSFVAESGTKINKALITAVGDNSSVAQRSAQAAIQVAQPAGIVIDKVALTPLVEINRSTETTLDPILWRLDFANIDTDPSPSDIDVIDVLPRNGVNGSSFSGGLLFDHATLIEGDEPGQSVEQLYTAAAAPLVDPADPTNNAASGSTTWCSLSGTTFTKVLGAGTTADCPATVADVTGLRFRRPGPFGPSDLLSVEVGMIPSSNHTGDTYVNETAGRAVGLTLTVGPVEAPATVVSSSVGDRVWDDTNGNGIQDSGEPGIAGFTVTLEGTDTDGNTVGPFTTTTDANGDYHFTGLQSGGYQVTFDPASLASGQHFTIRNAGANDLADSDGDPSTGVADVLLAANTDEMSIDQGVFTSDPSIEVVKSINGDDANSAPGVLVTPGAPMLVTFDVTNTGNMTLDPVRLTDDTIATADITCPQTALAAGATMTCTAAYPAPAAGVQHTNTATVTGTPVPLADGTQLPDVTADDPANAYGAVEEVSIDKTLSGAPVANGDGTYTVGYDITVTNDGTQDATYDLDDTLQFGAGATVTAAQVTSGPSGVTLNPAWDGAADTRIATAAVIPNGTATHAYHVEATASIDTATTTTSSSDCTIDQGETGTGFLNSATLTFNGATTDAEDCAGFPATTFDKELAGPPTANGDGTYTVDYDITVTNHGSANDHYDLADELRYADTITVDSATVTNTAPGTITPNAGWNGASDTQIVTHQTIGGGATHTYRVSVNATIDPDITLEESDCTVQSGETGTGFLNAAQLSVNGTDSADDACAAAPNTTMTKVLFGQPVVEADGTATATYVVTVTNSGAGADTYDLDDELRYGNDITVNTASVTNQTPGTITTNPGWNGAADTSIVAGQAIGSGATHTYVVTVNATIGTATTVSEADCTLDQGDTGTGLLNGATLTVNGETSDAEACGTVPPSLTIDKHIVGAPTRNVDGTWEITYDIDVANAVAPNTYDLDDTLSFGDGITIEDATVANTAPGSISTAADWDGRGHPGIVNTQAIGAGVTHTYRVTVTATVPGDATEAATDCTVGGGETGTGFLNSATVTTGTGSQDDDACAAAPVIKITKDLDGPAVVNPDGTVDTAYLITVTNTGAGDGTYDLADSLDFGAGITVNTADVVNTAPGTVTVNPAWDGTSDTSVATGVAIAGASGGPVTHTYRVTVNSTVGTATTTTGADCTVDSGENGTGFLNTATVTVDDHDQSDDACTSVTGVIAIDKHLVGTPTQNPDGTWELTYDIDVSNTVAPNTYDLTDRLAFGDGITVEAATVTNTAPGTITTDPSWDGRGSLGVVTDRAIHAGVTHTYRVTVTATVATDATEAATDCTLASGESGTGFLNRANLTTDDQDLTDTACGDAPAITITKDLVGQPAVNADHTIDATYTVTVTNTGAGAGTYDLADELQLGNGITANTATVTNATPGTVTTNPAWNGTSDTSVATAVAIAGAAGAPVTHTYTVKVNATVGTSTTTSDIDCTLSGSETGTGLLNTATVTTGGHDQTDDACGTAGPSISIDKHIVGSPERNADGTWEITYDIDVTNQVAPNSYDLDDTLSFGNGITIEDATVANTAPGTITTAGDWDGQSHPGIVNAQAIGAGVTHTYRVTVTATVPGDATEGATDCTVGGGETGTGFLNSAKVTTAAGDDTDTACAPAANVTITKALFGDPVVNDDNTVDTAYLITVTNSGAGSTAYDLADELRFGGGITVNDATVANQTPGDVTVNPAWDGTGDTAVATGVAIDGAAGAPVTHTYVVTVNATIGTTTTVEQADCTIDTGETGTGFLNTATVTVDRHESDDTACGSAGAEVTVTKTPAGAPTANGDGTWTIDYDITAVNDGAGPGTYDLDDTLRYAKSVSVVSAEVTNTAPGDVTVNPDWDGINDTRVATAAPIAAGATHTYRVSVEASVATTITSTETDCTVTTGETGSGFLNSAHISYDDKTSDDDACAEIASIHIVKELNGTPVVADDGTVTGRYTLTVTNTGGAEGTYRLTDKIRWGAGLTVNSAEVTGTPDGVSADPAWDGDTETVIAEDVPLAAGKTHVWEVTVTGTVTTAASTASGDCTTGTGENGTGLLNTATVTSNGQAADSSDCSPVKPPTKTVPRTDDNNPSKPATRTGYLPRTGSQLAGLALVGLALVAGGFVLRGGSRLRRKPTGN